MAGKINIPSVVGLSTDGIPYSMIIFLQAYEDALKTLDNKSVFRDGINTVVPAPRIQKKSAQGHAYPVGGTLLASGDDYGMLVNDFEALLQSHLDLRQTVDQLVKEVRGE